MFLTIGLSWFSLALSRSRNLALAISLSQSLSLALSISCSFAPHREVFDEFIPPSAGGIGWLRPLLFFKGREVPVLLLETNSI